MRVVALLALAACEHGQTPPGSDATKPPIDSDNPCGNNTLVEGELIDWDSSDADFLGVFNARITQVGDASVAQSTPPNGRLMLCANPVPLPLTFAVVPSDDHLIASIQISPRVLQSSFLPLSIRSITATRAPSFFTERSLVFDPDAAHLVVVQTGDRTAMSISSSHDTAQAGDDLGNNQIAWGAGSTGRYVLFPNISASATDTTVTGDPDGPHIVPLVAGKLSVLATSFVFE